jgi:hypothetical protein
MDLSKHSQVVEESKKTIDKMLASQKFSGDDRKALEVSSSVLGYFWSVVYAHLGLDKAIREMSKELAPIPILFNSQADVEEFLTAIIGLSEGE